MFGQIKLDYKSDNDIESVYKDFAKNLEEKYNQTLSNSGVKGRIECESNGTEITISIVDLNNEVKRKIPYKVVNGKIIVPKEFQKYVSSDGKQLNMKEDNDIANIIERINNNLNNVL